MDKFLSMFLFYEGEDFLEDPYSTMSEVLLQLCIGMIRFGALHKSLMPRSFVENNSNLRLRDKQERKANIITA